MKLNRSHLGRLFTAALMLTGSAGIGALTGTPAAGADSGGSISGTVTDETSHPLADMCVSVEGGPGTTTDGNGSYSITGIPAGDYRIQFSDCANPRAYLTQWYLHQPRQSSAQYVNVSDGEDTPLSTVNMHAGVSVTGRVTDSSHNGIENIHVQLDPMGDYGSGSATTDANGDYRTEPLENGSYRVRFDDWARGYATQYWNANSSYNTADPLNLNVADGTGRTGIDATLYAGAHVSGNVTDSGHNPLENMCVNANIATSNGWNGVGNTNTDADGNYDLGPLPPVPVRIQFNPCNQGSPYLQQWYQGATRFEDANELLLSEGSNTPNINAVMSTGSVVSGTVTDGGGNPVANINVNLDGGNKGAHGWAQTDAAGHYTTSAVPQGDYRVSFNDNRSPRVYANAYWNDAPSYNSATILHVDDPVEIGIDAHLTKGATITGTVTGPDDTPAANICVQAIQNTPSNPDQVASSQTGPSGKYTVDGIPAGDTMVRFEDCQGSGPYSDQFYNNTTNFNDAQWLNLAEGETHSGVDAQMHAATLISGTVTDSAEHHPLAGICVQATTATAVGGMTQTGDDGTYTLQVGAGGTYRVQFVDCQGGKYLGTWYGGTIEPSSAKSVVADPSTSTGDIDAEMMIAGSSGRVGGTVTDARGKSMANVCVVLYLPSNFVLFSQTDSSGRFSFENVPTGTWTIGYLGCGEGDGPSPVVTDPDTGVNYWGRWVGGAVITFNDESPDPVAQGAGFVTVHPGETLSEDMCFGCGSVSVTSTKLGADSVTVGFDTPGLMPGGVGFTAEAALSYTLGCTSRSGTAVSVSGPDSPLTATGFTKGAVYTCTVSAFSDKVLVANTAQFSVTIGKAPAPAPSNPGATSPSGPAANTPASGSTPQGGSAASPSASSPNDSSTKSASSTPLAFTGSSIGMLVLIASVLLLLGGSAAGAGRLQHNQEETARRRANS